MPHSPQTRTSQNTRLRNRHTWRRAHARSTARVPATTNMAAATWRLRNRSLSQGKNQNASNRNQYFSADRTAKVRERVLPL